MSSMKLVFSVFFILSAFICTFSGATVIASSDGLPKRSEIGSTVLSSTNVTRTRRQATTSTPTQPIRYQIPSGATATLTCTNVDHFFTIQRASFKFPAPIGIVQFQGNSFFGPQAMTIVGSTSTAFAVAATSSAYPVSSTFEFTNTIPNNFQPTVVRNVAFMPGIPPVLNITTEDTADHNSNDMTCLITNALPPLLAASQCHTGGGVQCCQSVIPVTSDPTILQLLILLGLAPGPDTTVGITCSAVTVNSDGTTSPSCPTPPVCCTSSAAGGVGPLGCQQVDLTA